MAGTGKLPEGKVKDYKLLVLGSFLRESKGLQMAGAGQLPEGKVKDYKWLVLGSFLREKVWD